MRITGSVFLSLCAAASVVWAAEGSFERKLSVSGPVDLDVVSDSGRIAIRTGSAGGVRVYGRIKTGMGWNGGPLSPEEKVKRLEANPPVEQSGNSIRIGHIRDRDLERNVSISYEIEVPAECKVRSRSDSGSQVIEGVKGRVEAAADSGSLEIANIGGPVQAETDSGSIRLRTIQSGATAKADSGSVHALGIAGAVDVHTDSGSVEVEQSAPGAVRVGTDSGSVSVRLPSGGGYDVSAVSDSGRVESDLALTVRGTVGRNKLHGVLRGGGNTLAITTDSGSIHLK